MNAAIAMARSYGIRVSFADLGDWGLDELRSEYDPKGPEIRLNIRVAEQLTSEELGEFVVLAPLVGVAGVQRLAHPFQHLVVELQPAQQIGKLLFDNFLANIGLVASAP